MEWTGRAVVHYLLLLTPNSSNEEGHFSWVNDKDATKNNVIPYYLRTEEIDVCVPALFFVSKVM